LFLISSWDLFPLLIASFIIWGMGLVDDLESLPPNIKLSIEILVSLLLIFFGWQIQWSDSRLLNFAASIFWMVGITNAFNLIDNMDGLSTGISIIALVFLGLLASTPIPVMVLLGISCGFLIFNFPPARVFMGDCGALFLGFNMACLSMDPKIGLLALPILIVPLADTTFVTIRRLLKRKSPAKGGLDHLSHELAKRTHFQLAAVCILWTVGTLGGLFAVLI